MESLGNQNLFFSHFVWGCELSIFKEEKRVTETLHNWLKHLREVVYVNEENFSRSHKICTIDFLHIIELDELKQSIEELLRIYKRNHPYGTNEDFVNDIFSYTLYELKKFTDYEIDFDLVWSTTFNNYDFYYYYDIRTNEKFYYVIPSNITIRNYNQYYKVVIDLINSYGLSEIKLKEPNTNKPIKQTKEDTDRHWFKVGLMFAVGEISLNITDHQETNFSKLAKEEKGNENFRPYIEGTIKDNQDNNTDKNIFHKTRKPQRIINYCNENNIEISKEFIDKFNLLKSEL